MSRVRVGSAAADNPTPGSICRALGWLGAALFLLPWTWLQAALPLGEPLPEPPALPWEERENWAGGEDEEPRLFVAEFRVQGSTKLDANEIGRAVYPYLGEDRSLEDLEGARLALERAFHAKGYQTVTVELPQQRGRGGVVYLQVKENRVGRLRVTGSRFFDIEKVRRRAKSLREGEVPNFEEVQREILALNRHPDRRVIPTLRPGAEAGTIDVDLEIQDTFPFHGAIELNNRYSPNTTPLRLDLSARYTNLWQEGHTVGFGFQIAPQNPDDATIFTGFYLLPVPGVDNLSFMVQGTLQDSDVSTLQGSATAGNGSVVGARLIYTLPMGEGFFHSISFGWDYKNFQQDITLVEGEDPLSAPVQYYPFSLAYTASWVGEGYQTELAGSLNWLFRGWGSTTADFDRRRFGADGGYLYFRGNLSHARTLPYGFQIFGEVQGQLANQPLVDSEQFSGGGLYTVRGYLESVVLGDSAVATTVELRSPDFLKWMGQGNEGRVYGFVDAGYWELVDPLPEQDSQFTLVGVGFGTRLKFLDLLNGSVDVGSPMITQGPSRANSLLLTFRAWADF